MKAVVRLFLIAGRAPPISDGWPIRKEDRLGCTFAAGYGDRVLFRVAVQRGANGMEDRLVNVGVEESQGPNVRVRDTFGLSRFSISGDVGTITNCDRSICERSIRSCRSSSAIDGECAGGVVVSSKPESVRPAVGR